MLLVFFCYCFFAEKGIQCLLVVRQEHFHKKWLKGCLCLFIPRWFCSVPRWSTTVWGWEACSSVLLQNVLKNTFGSYDLMANMVDPLRRAQYDNSSPNNPWNVAPNVSQLRNLALAELGESYPQPFLVPGKKPKNPSPGLLKSLISNKRFLSQTYVGMDPEGAFAVKVSKQFPFFI